MFKKMKAVFFAAAGMLMSIVCVAQNTLPEDKVEMATGMRANGKIYVVVAVLATILTGIVLYIVRIDRKITRLEK